MIVPLFLQLAAMAAPMPASAAPTPSGTAQSSAAPATQVATRAPRCEGRHAPGAIIVATTERYPYAFRLADRLADAGVIILLPHNGDATVNDLEADMRMALDSIRRRDDVCAHQVGVIVLSGAPRLMPSLLRDTSLAFVVSMRVPPDTMDNVNYTVARTPTLVLRARTIALDTLHSVELESGASDNRSVSLTAHVGDAVTIWPLAHGQLDRFTEPLEPLADRVVQWIQRRVIGAELTPSRTLNTVSIRLDTE